MLICSTIIATKTEMLSPPQYLAFANMNFGFNSNVLEDLVH